jgi:sugar lactone lactonase YvrE
MNSRRLFLAVALFAATATCRAYDVVEVANFGDQQVTGVGVSKKTGRVFVNFPNWSDNHGLSVAELVDGKPKAFPNDEWNKAGAAGSHFICVQSVVVDDQDNLWILDPAAPKMQEIVKGGPKLVKIDLKTNKVAQTIPFGEEIAPKKSYLNDVRVDTAANVAFITDSANGAIIVVDLKSGKARRLLDGHSSTQPEKDFNLKVRGRELLDSEKKTPPQIASDGIALDTKNGFLYYHALTARNLYRIPTAALIDEKLPKADLESKVETVTQTAAADGLLEAPDGTIYLTDIQRGGISRWNATTKQVEPVITDARLMWPDTLAWSPKGELYVTASQIQNMPRFNNGESIRTEPYQLWKITGL